MVARPDPGSRRRPTDGGGEEAGRRAGPLTTLTGLAPAKVNLFLHVGPPTDDGYHPLSSLVAFADVGDVVTVRQAERLSLTVTGPFAADLGLGEDNLILKALRALGAAAGPGDPPVAVTLDKRLPIAAGLGGGSSDAGAALKLTNRLLSLGQADDRLEALSRVVGADGPMCLRAQSVWAEGIGDRLIDVPQLTSLAAVLVNPGVPSPTGAVYRAYDASGPRAADRPAPPLDWSPQTVSAWLSEQRNDLETPAVALAPAIGQALAAVRAQAGARLTRMSGSGATVFALFDNQDDAQGAASALSNLQPSWWVTATTLSNPDGQA